MKKTEAWWKLCSSNCIYTSTDKYHPWLISHHLGLTWSTSKTLISTKLKRSLVTCSALKRTSNISQHIAMPSPHSPVMQRMLDLTQDFRSRRGFLLLLLLFLDKGSSSRDHATWRKRANCSPSFLNQVLWLSPHALTSLFFYLGLWHSDFLIILLFF